MFFCTYHSFKRGLWFYWEEDWAPGFSKCHSVHKAVRCSAWSIYTASQSVSLRPLAAYSYARLWMAVFLMLSFQGYYLELQMHVKHCDVTQHWPVSQLVSTWKSKELRRLQRSSGSATPTHATPHHTHTHTPQGLSVTLSCCPSHTSHSSAERCLCAPFSPSCTWGHYMCWSPRPL